MTFRQATGKYWTFTIIFGEGSLFYRLFPIVYAFLMSPSVHTWRYGTCRAFNFNNERIDIFDVTLTSEWKRIGGDFHEDLNRTSYREYVEINCECNKGRYKYSFTIIFILLRFQNKILGKRNTWILENCAKLPKQKWKKNYLH